ncbi:MAG: carboxypeptidase-like regulatory domain-containing protein, partial [Salinivirgaceae bacterium]|nr:carboxypeptidase-like regulatory domain-containing protein [Salinivirgaceae bacterium]
MKRILFLAVCLMLQNQVVEAQSFTQNIRGVVFDAASGMPVPFATVYVEDQPTQGAAADTAGRFVIKNVTVGRHTVIVQTIGYEPLIMKELMVSSAKETYVEAGLHESVTTLGEVTVRPKINKQQPLNK